MNTNPFIEQKHEDSPPMERDRVGPRTKEWMVSPLECPTLAEHNIELTGIAHGKYGLRFFRQKPYMSVLIICHEGEAKVWVDGEWKICRRGTAYIAPPNMFHAYYVERGRQWKISWLRYLHGKNQTPFVNIPGPKLMKVDPEPFLASIQNLYRESIGAADPVILQSWTEVIHALAVRITRPWHLDDHLWQLWEKADANLAHPWTLKELAGMAHLSEEHLRRLCRRHLGRSPMEHITYLRMRRAAGMLTSGSEIVEVIAKSVGYSTLQSFSAAFKRVMKKSPAAFRRRH